MHRTKFAGPTDKIIPTPSDIIHHEEADIDLDGWVVVESQDFPNEAKYLSGTNFWFILNPINNTGFFTFRPIFNLRKHLLKANYTKNTTFSVKNIAIT